MVRRLKDTTTIGTISRSESEDASISRGPSSHDRMNLILVFLTLIYMAMTFHTMSTLPNDHVPLRARMKRVSESDTRRRTGADDNVQTSLRSQKKAVKDKFKKEQKPKQSNLYKQLLAGEGPARTAREDQAEREAAKAAAEAEAAAAAATAGKPKSVKRAETAEIAHKPHKKHVGFPIRAKEFETIPHPGNPEATLKVPKFWSPEGEDLDAVRRRLGNYGEHIMSPKDAASIGWKTTVGDQKDLETIYVSIASYRDDECSNTIEDIFVTAKYPTRVRVAAVDQRTHGDSKCGTPKVPCDEDPDQALCKYKHLIDVYQMEASLGVGPVFARHLAHRMYRGEYFALQCDAHTRFVNGWDEDVIDQWKTSGNEMAVLSTYLSDVESINMETHESLTKTRPIMCNSDYEASNDMKHLRHGAQPETSPDVKGSPTLQPFWAAGFSFARGHFVVNIPYDQYLPMIFQGEEISMGLRGFSYGYDFYAPERSICFHIYHIAKKEKTDSKRPKRHKVKMFWENANKYEGTEVESMKRLNGIIKMGHEGEKYDKRESKRYGIGHVREVEKFFKVFGIDHKKQTVEQNLCKFVGAPMHKQFTEHLREDGMGIDYSKVHFSFKDPKKTEEKESEDSEEQKEEESAEEEEDEAPSGEVEEAAEGGESEEEEEADTSAEGEAEESGEGGTSAEGEAEESGEDKGEEEESGEESGEERGEQNSAEGKKKKTPKKKE